MKTLKLNILQKSILIFCISILVVGCSKDDNIETQLIEDAFLDKRNSSDYDVSYGDHQFFVYDNGEALKYKEGRYQYKMIPSVDFLNQVEYIEKDDFVKISNTKTGEFINIINVTKKDRYYTFDIITSTGHKLKNIKLGFNNQNVDIQNKFCWPCLILPIAGMVVDLLTDSPLEECTNAMNSLNCSQGTNPFMNFNEGGWFSSASCSVGCN